MAAPVGVGDWVECVASGSAGGFPLRAGYRIVPGALYCVREIVRGRYPNGLHGDGFRLHGVVSLGTDGREGAWAAECFRPVYRPNADFIESLKAPPKSAPRQPTLPTRTPEVASLKSRDEQNLPAHGVGAGV